MFDNLKKRYTESNIPKITKLFKRKALPPIPKDLAANKPLQKAVIRKHRRKVGKRLLCVVFGSAALSAGLQLTPDLVSTKFDDFMVQRGYPADLSKNFSTGEIRVYDRFNPLYPFHLAGREVGMIWHESLKEQHVGPIFPLLATPRVYVQGLWNGTKDMFPGSQLDAYSMAPNDALKNRVNFIRPPDEFSLNGFLEDFSGQDGSALKFKSDRNDLRYVLFEFVMLHEARHGDQQKLAFINANEADADLYAFQVMASRGVPPALLNEAATIVAHARAINGAMRGDAAHASTFTLERGRERIFDAYEDATDFSRLHMVLAEADHRNDAAFPADMPAGNR
jgi:hypothetical protein